MPLNQTLLSQEEQHWILEQRITRLTDNQEALIYPMGAERYLSSVLHEKTSSTYNIRKDIIGKDVLVIPGYGNSAFLFAQAGAKSVTVYDKDPVTLAWVKAFKKYFHYRENIQYPSVGELLDALTCWYPPLLSLPSDRFRNRMNWLLNPKALRKTYVLYLLHLVRQAIEQNNQANFEWEKDITFCLGELSHLIALPQKPIFDTAFIPYLLGVQNGIEEEQEIVHFVKELTQVIPYGSIIITPACDVKEFHFVGQRYFNTTGYEQIIDIPELRPFFKEGDRFWFKTQGVAVLSKP